MKYPQSEKLLTRNFILTSLSTFAIFTSFYFLLVTLPIYIIKLGGSESEIGLIIGIFTISAVLLRLFIGQEINRRGRKNILIAGSLVFLASTLLYNYTTSVISLLLLRVLHGIGWGAATTAASTLIADIAPANRRGEAMGIFGIASNVAMAIGPILSILVLNVYNFPTLFEVSAAIAFVSLLLVLPISETVVMHPKTPPFNKEALFPSTVMFIISVTYGSIMSFIPVFTMKQGINPGTFLTTYAVKYGIPYSGSDLAAAIFLTVFAVILILVRALAGKLSDLKGREYVIVPGMVLITLGLWILSVSGSFLVFLIAAVLYGLGFGFVHPTLMAFLVDRVSVRGLGAAMGTFTAAFDLGIGSGSIILGVVLQFLGFRVMYLLSGLIVLAGAIWFISKGNRKGM